MNGIKSAGRCPLLGICLPQRSPHRLILSLPHPAGTCDLYQVVGPPCWWPTHAASSGTLSPRSASYVPCRLPLQLGNPSSYVSDLSSLADLLNLLADEAKSRAAMDWGMDALETPADAVPTPGQRAVLYAYKILLRSCPMYTVEIDTVLSM